MNMQIPSRVKAITSSNRIPQTLLIEALNEDLRDICAEYVAKAIVCSSENKPCLVCKNCKKAESSIHPDITVIGDDKKQKNIKVDKIRELRNNAYIKPNEAEARVFIIKNADTMNEEAQNALLKLLEEPPETVGIILAAASRSRLLATVRSRLSLVNVDGESSVNEVKRLSPLAEETLLNLSHKNGYGILKALHSVTNDRIVASRLFEEIKSALIKAVVIKNGGEYPLEAAQEAAVRLTGEQLINLCDWCDEGVKKMNANANKVSASVWLSVRANKILGI